MVVALAESDCERLHPGWLAQPANAVSSLAYVAVGAWLLWHAFRSGADRLARLAGGCAMVGAGAGSVVYHGPQPGWAPPAHDAGVWSLVLVLIVQHIWVLARPITRGLVLTAWRSAAPWICRRTSRLPVLRPVRRVAVPRNLARPECRGVGLAGAGLLREMTVRRRISGRAGWPGAACPALHPSCSRPAPCGRSLPVPGPCPVLHP